MNTIILQARSIVNCSKGSKGLLCAFIGGPSTRLPHAKLVTEILSDVKMNCSLKDNSQGARNCDGDLGDEKTWESSHDVNGRRLVVTGRWLRVASVQDEEVLEGDVVDSPESFIERLRQAG